MEMLRLLPPLQTDVDRAIMLIGVTGGFPRLDRRGGVMTRRFGNVRRTASSSVPWCIGPMV